MIHKISLKFILAEDNKKFLIQEQELDMASVDAQIDRYLSIYERESQKSADTVTKENKSIKQFVNFLFEDEGDELINKLLKKKKGSEEKHSDSDDEQLKIPELPEEPEDNEQESEAEPETSTEQEQEETPEEPQLDALPAESEDDKSGESESEELPDSEQELKTPQHPGQIDISAFIGRTTNFIKNSYNLLDLKSVIMNRAYNMIKQNYGDEDAEKFRRVLKTQYGFNVNEDI